MRTFVHTFWRTLQDKRVIVALIACACLGGIVAAFSMHSSSRFAKEYADYAVLANIQENAANIPGATNNPVREKLNDTLALALADNQPPASRIRYATDGLNILKQSEAQIDAIGDANSKADLLIAQMQVDSLKDFSSGGAAHEIITLAKQRSSIAADIRNLSYRADFEIEKIFNRIIEDKGVLTSAHVAELNDDIPNVESQYNQRLKLYEELQKTRIQIDKKAAQYGFATSSQK